LKGIISHKTLKTENHTSCYIYPGYLLD